MLGLKIKNSWRPWYLKNGVNFFQMYIPNAEDTVFIFPLSNVDKQIMLKSYADEFMNNHNFNFVIAGWRLCRRI